MDEQTVRDLNRKYTATVVQIRNRETGASEVVIVNDISLNDSGVAQIRFTKSDGVRDSKKLKNYDLLDAPDSGVFEYKGVVCYYKRRPERQWRRGICPDNSTLDSPLLQMIYDTGGIVHIDQQFDLFSPDALQDLFYPNPASLRDAISQLDAGTKISATVTQKNFVSVSEMEDKYILWRMNKPLCEFVPSSRTAKCYDGIYNQEVADFFNRQGEYYALVASS